MATSVMGSLARRAWWIWLVAGIVMALVGLAIMLWPQTSIAIAVVVLGIGWIIEGVSSLVAVAQRTIVGSRGWAIAAGVISILGGIAAVLFPSIGALVGITAGVFLLGFGMVFSGVRWIVTGWQSERRDWWGVVLGALYVIGAVILMLNPIAGGIVLVIMLGAWGLVAGLMTIVGAFVLRSATRELERDASDLAGAS